MIAIAKASDTEREVLFGNAADRAGMPLPCAMASARQPRPQMSFHRQAWHSGSLFFSSPQVQFI